MWASSCPMVVLVEGYYPSPNRWYIITTAEDAPKAAVGGPASNSAKEKIKMPFFKALLIVNERPEDMFVSLDLIPVYKFSLKHTQAQLNLDPL